MRYIITTIAALLMICSSIPAGAVTKEEMEEAKAITAKAYLRYANDGSGYLDDITVKSMSELNGKLKAKEKENIAAFNKVKIPTDYASWDKAKLVEFWAVTFFTSPELSDKGKAAKARVRKQIEAMSISAPAAEAAPAEAAPAAEEAAPAATEEAVPSAEQAVEEQQDILQDQQSIAKDAADAAAPREEESHTWVYVLVLVILIAVVVWLVVYAANLMKKRPGEEDATDADYEELRDKAKRAMAAKDAEIEELHRRLEAEETRSADLVKELELLKRDHGRDSEAADRLREENVRLNAELNRLRGEGTRQRPAERPAVEPAVRPVRRKAAEAEADAPVIRKIYLGRANARGLFVRADRRISRGNTVYVLNTDDGLVGTFHVVNDADVIDFALSDPEELLGGGCTGEELADTRGVSDIVTDSAGTAIFENGYWKVLRKSRIHYE